MVRSPFRGAQQDLGNPSRACVRSSFCLRPPGFRGLADLFVIPCIFFVSAQPIIFTMFHNNSWLLVRTSPRFKLISFRTALALLRPRVNTGIDLSIFTDSAVGILLGLPLRLVINLERLAVLTILSLPINENLFISSDLWLCPSVYFVIFFVKFSFIFPSICS